MVGFPNRTKTNYTGFTVSFMMTCKLILEKGWTFSVHESNNDCFVCSARNQIVASFMHSDCTHLWMIDDDMEWEPAKIIEMIELNKDFIAAVGNFKEDNPRYACQPYTDAGDGKTGTPIVENGLIWAKGVGGACTIYKRNVIEKLIERWPSKKCKAMDEKNDVYGYSFYWTSYDRQGMRTEDQNFGDLVDLVGIKMWVYPDMNFTHFGYKEFKGNFHKYLLGLKKPAQRRILLG